MKYEGIDKGSATGKNYKGTDGWTELASVKWGTGRHINDASQGTDRQAEKASVSEIVVTKILDMSSYRLFEESLKGEGKTVTIHFTTTPDDTDCYMEYILSNVLVSGFSTNSSGGRPVESVRLNFTKIEYNYTAKDDKNKTTDAPKTSWDLAQSSKP
jgi:type VI secretion system secreted protein Hcp